MKGDLYISSYMVKSSGFIILNSFFNNLSASTSKSTPLQPHIPTGNKTAGQQQHARDRAYTHTRAQQQQQLSRTSVTVSTPSFVDVVVAATDHRRINTLIHSHTRTPNRDSPIHGNHQHNTQTYSTSQSHILFTFYTHKTTRIIAIVSG